MKRVDSPALPRRHMKSIFAALTCLSVACLAACSSSDDDSSDVEPVDQQLVDDFRTVLGANGVTALGAPPSFPQPLVDLGRALFFDKELSGNRDIACSTCHLPSFGGGDGLTLPRGVGAAGLGTSRVGGPIIPRNAPTVLNVHSQDTMFWDGRVRVTGGGTLETPAGAQLTAAMEAVFQPGIEALAAQAMFPPTSREEMRGAIGENELGDIADGDFTAIWDAIVTRLVSFPEYVTMFGDAYPGVAVVDLNMAHVGNAIAAFEAVEFHRVDSPFEDFLSGNDTALTNLELRGGLQFYSPQSRCSQCHSGPTFTDLLFHNIGMPQLGPGKGDGIGMDDDFGRENATGVAMERYRFRTPTLLNVELHGPYGHAGQFSSLRSMIAHYRDVTDSLDDYDIMEHVTDPDLIATQVANQTEVLSRLAPQVQGSLNFNLDAMEAFMRALTAESARDVSDVVPSTVPSGLTIDA